MPRRPIHVDRRCDRDTDQYAYEAVPDRAHNDDGALYAIPAALNSLTDNYPVQHPDQTKQKGCSDQIIVVPIFNSKLPGFLFTELIRPRGLFGAAVGAISGGEGNRPPYNRDN